MAPCHISDVNELLAFPPKRHFPSTPLTWFNSNSCSHDSIFHKKLRSEKSLKFRYRFVYQNLVLSLWEKKKLICEREMFNVQFMEMFNLWAISFQKNVLIKALMWWFNLRGLTLASKVSDKRCFMFMVPGREMGNNSYLHYFPIRVHSDTKCPHLSPPW